MKPRLAGPRARRASLMEDACAIVRPPLTDSGTLNPATLQIVSAAPTAVYAGPCKMGSKLSRMPAGRRLQHRLTEQGAELLQLHVWSCALPWSVTGILIGDVLTLTGLGEQGDPELLTKTWIVTAVGGGDYVTERQLELEDVVVRPAWTS